MMYIYLCYNGVGDTMRENMIYDTNHYQLRESVLLRMLEIIAQRKECHKGGIVFYGDSITQYFPLQQYMSDLGDCINCGIAGMTSDILLKFIDEGVIKYQPKEVFLMIGTNDLGNTVMASPRDIALNVKEMVEIIHYNLPETKIHVLGCIPCIEEIHGYKAENKGMRSNDILKMIDKEYRRMIPYDYVHFIPLFQSLCNKKGEVIKDLYVDGLHIHEKGYEMISQTIHQKIIGE